MFVTVDPERDTTAWLNEFARYMPTGFAAVTGTAAEIAATAAGWGVTYAREDIAVDGDYGMSHTADVYLVDRAGMLRARFPFGTGADVMTAVAREVGTTTTPTANAGAARPRADRPGRRSRARRHRRAQATSSHASDGHPDSSRRRGRLDLGLVRPTGPIILALSVGGGRLADPSLRPTVQLASMAGAPSGPA